MRVGAHTHTHTNVHACTHAHSSIQSVSTFLCSVTGGRDACHHPARVELLALQPADGAEGTFPEEGGPVQWKCPFVTSSTFSSIGYLCHQGMTWVKVLPLLGFHFSSDETQVLEPSEELSGGGMLGAHALGFCGSLDSSLS